MKMHATSPFEVFKKFYLRLIKVLPMNDECFIGDLFTKELLPGNLKAEIKALPTSVTKASKFLDDVIQPPLENDSTILFDILLNLMIECDYLAVKQLAEEIITSLNEKSSFDNKRSK